jgi:hypothetical protein
LKEPDDMSAALFSVGAVGAAQARQRAASSYDRAFFIRFRSMNQNRAVIDRAFRRGGLQSTDKLS